VWAFLSAVSSPRIWKLFWWLEVVPFEILSLGFYGGVAPLENLFMNIGSEHRHLYTRD
jgi:hypothetical protein